MHKRGALAIFLLAFALDAALAAPPQQRPADLAVSFSTAWPGLFLGTVAQIEQEQRWYRLQRFLGGIEVSSFRMRPGAVNAYVMTSDADGDASWQPVSAVVGTVNDNAFIVQNTAAPTKKFRFDASGITAGATRVLTVPDQDGTLALLQRVQSFTAAQTFAPTSGTAVTLTPPSGTATMLGSSYTDTAFPSSGGPEIISLAPTISNTVSGIGNGGGVYGMQFSPTISDILDATEVRGFRIFATYRLHDNCTAVIPASALAFRLKTQGGAAAVSGGGSFGSTVGINAHIYHNSVDAISNFAGANLTLQADDTGLGGATPGLITTMNGFLVTPASPIKGPITTLNAFNLASNPTVSAPGSIATFNGLKLPNLTAGSTNWSLNIGTSSSAAPSLHWGKISFGGSTAPAAMVHIQGTSATVPAMRWAAAAQPSSPGEGDLWNESTRNATGRYVNGVVEYIPGVLYTDTSSTTVTNTTTETDLVGLGIGTVTIPANFFGIGKTIRVTARGTIEAASGASDTLRIRLYYGGLAGTVIYDSDRQQVSASANSAWEVSVLLTARTAAGASAIIASQGWFTHTGGGSGPLSTSSWNVRPQAGGAILRTVGTNAAGAIALSAKWGNATTSDVITRTHLIIESLN